MRMAEQVGAPSKSGIYEGLKLPKREGTLHVKMAARTGARAVGHPTRILLLLIAMFQSQVCATGDLTACFGGDGAICNQWSDMDTVCSKALGPNGDQYDAWYECLCTSGWLSVLQR